MKARSGNDVLTPVLLGATAASFLTNCVLGIVAWRRHGIGRARWLHHAFFISTSTLATASVASAAWEGNRAGWYLLPAAVPLTLIPRLSARTPGHVVIALTIAPFVAASSWKARR
jgi:hypothetical protein